MLDRDKYLELYSANDNVGSVFRQGMARNLITQLLAAQARYTALETEHAVRDEQLLRGTPVSTIWRD